MEITAYQLAEKFVGMSEVAGTVHNPAILAMLRLDDDWPESDEVPWCSAFMNFIAHLLDLPRSYSLWARSWLEVGIPISPEAAEPGFDVSIFGRGPDPPGPEVIDAPGHVAWFASYDGEFSSALGGNQKNSVRLSTYHARSLIAVRRLYA